MDASSTWTGASSIVVAAISIVAAAAAELVAGHELVDDGVDGRTEVGRRVAVLLDACRLRDQRFLLPAVDDRLLMNVLPQHQSAVRVRSTV